MNLKKHFYEGVFWRTASKIVPCLVLASLGLAGVRVVWKNSVTREPFIEFSRADRDGETSEFLKTPPQNDRLRFAVATMVSAEETFSTYQRLVQRICRDVGRKEAFVLRPSYTKVREALEHGKVDIALVCTGTYVHSLGRKRIKLLVQPEFEEPLEYRCLIIVPAKGTAQTLDDIRGKVMAFTDPESNTGCFVPTATFMNRGENPRTFFSKVVFTGSHDRSILAVSMAVVDAAAIDALIWQSKLREDPSLATKVRIIWQSEVFGPPPIVVPVDGDPVIAKLLQEALLALDKDEQGKEILSEIGIKRFAMPQEESYLSAIKLHRQLKRAGDFSWD